MACGILVLQPGIKPVPPALEGPSPNYWTTKEAPILSFLTNVRWNFSLIQDSY